MFMKSVIVFHKIVPSFQRMDQQNHIHNMCLPRKIVFVLLLVVFVEGGSLATNNCPASFDATAVNVTGSASLQDAVDFLYSNLYSAEVQASLQAGFSTGNTSSVSTQAIALSVVLPFALIAAAFFVAFIVALCCCIFEKSCPPCKSWKRDFATRPYQKSQLKCVTVFTAIFAAGIAITTLVSFIFLPKLQEDITNTKCGLYLALDVAVNGDQTNHWGGFTQIKDQIGNVSSLLSTASTAVSTQLSSNDWLVTDMAALHNQNLNLYKDNNESTVYSPNSATTESAISGSTPLPTVTPLFIASGLGPNSTTNTMVNDLDSGIRVTQQLSSQGYKVYEAGQLLAHSSNTITANLAVASSTLTLNANYMTSIQISLDSFRANIFDNVFNWGLYLIQGVLGLVLAASLLLLLGLVAVHFFDFLACKTSVHLGWVAYGVTYFGIVVLCFLFFSLGGLSYQFCEFYSSIVTSSTSFSAYAQATGPNQFNRFFDKLNTCFYGDGNIMSEFDIKQDTMTVSQLYSEIETFINMRDSSKTQYIDMTYSTNKISSWMTAMDQYKLGIYVDANSGLTTEDNPQIALAGMNKYTNNGTSGSPPSCTNDFWVFDSTNCTHAATESLYVSDATTSGITFASSGSLCISFNQKFQSTNNYAWTVSDIALRYLSRRQCSGNTQSYQNILKYAQSLINYRDSRINLYTNLKDQLNSLLTSNTNFNSKLVTFTTNVNSFLATTSTLNTLITNAVNGLDASSNCTTIANHLRLVNNVFCKRFLYSAVQFGICCLVLLGLMIGGTLTGAVFATRYGRIQQDIKAVRPETPSLQELHSQTFEKKHESSSSSSSSDED